MFYFSTKQLYRLFPPATGTQPECHQNAAAQAHKGRRKTGGMTTHRDSTPHMWLSQLGVGQSHKEDALLTGNRTGTCRERTLSSQSLHPRRLQTHNWDINRSILRTKLTLDKVKDNHESTWYSTGEPAPQVRTAVQLHLEGKGHTLGTSKYTFQMARQWFEKRLKKMLMC